MEYSTAQKGHIAFLATEQRALLRGCIVSKPSLEGCLYDCIVDRDGQLYRCQVKYADGTCGQRTQGSVVVSLSSWSGRSASGKTIRKGYNKEQIDVLIVYIPKLDEVLWIPIEVLAGKGKASIRLEPPLCAGKNFNFASEYIW